MPYECTWQKHNLLIVYILYLFTKVRESTRTEPETIRLGASCDFIQLIKSIQFIKLHKSVKIGLD